MLRPWDRLESVRRNCNERWRNHMMTFRLSFAVQAVVARKLSDLDRVQKRFPQLIYNTGFLKATP